MLELGDTEDDGDIEADAAPGAVTTLPNILSKTAPVTVNKVAVPTAPALAWPVKLIVFTSVSDQSESVTAAPFLFCCCAIFISCLF